MHYNLQISPTFVTYLLFLLKEIGIHFREKRKIQIIMQLQSGFFLNLLSLSTNLFQRRTQNHPLAEGWFCVQVGLKFFAFPKTCAPIRIVQTSNRGWSTSQKHVRNPLNPRKLFCQVGNFFLLASCTFLGLI